MMAKKYGLILFLITLFFYNANLRPIASGDTVPTSLIPITILTKGNIVMDEYNQYYLKHSVVPYFFRETKFGYLPAYPIMTGLLITPIYVIPVYAFQIAKGHPMTDDWIKFAGVMEKIVASLITALSVVLFYLLCMRLGTSNRLALILSMTYALASQAWVISAQALWQHGMGVLFMLLASILAIMQKEKPTIKKAILFSIACAISVAVRPTNIIFIVPFFLWITIISRTYISYYIIPAAVVAFALATYNYTVLGNIKGAYTQSFNMPFFEGFKGVLFSPGRGLFIYFPLAFLGVAGYFFEVFNRTKYYIFYTVLMIFILAQTILISNWYAWWGGYCYGPRLLTEIQPFLILLLIPYFSNIKKVFIKWGVFLIFLIWSLFVQSIGVFVYPAGFWDTYPVSVDKCPARLWDWKDNPIGRSALTLINKYRIKTKPLTDWKAEYSTTQEAIVMAPGEEKIILVSVKNTSTEPWANFSDSRGRYVVNLSYHIYAQDGQIIIPDGNRVGLSRVIWPGESIDLWLPVKAPSVSGKYIVSISLVQELEAWFHDRGVKPIEIVIDVK